MCDAGGQQTLPLQLLPEEQREGASGAAKSQPITPVLEAPMIDVQKLDRLQQLLATSRALVNGDLTLEQAKQLHAHETRVVTRPDGTEEWLNIICPADATPGMQLEVKKGNKSAIVLVPDGVHPGDKFNAVASHVPVAWGNDDLERKISNTVYSDHELVVLPDGSEEWRNITCPPGGHPGKTLELKMGGKRAVVLVPYGVKTGDRFNAKPVHFTTKRKQKADSSGSDHQLCAHPDGGWVWRNVLCPPDCKPGAPLQLTSAGVNMVVMVPPGTEVGDVFDARPIDYDLSKPVHEQKPEIQKLISGHKLKIASELGDTRKIHGPEAAMRARLERKLKQRQQAKKSALEPEPEQLIVSPSLEALAEEYGTFKLKKDVDAACREAAEERAKREKKAAAKREKKKRQKQRKRAESAAAVPAAAAARQQQQRAPVPEIEEAPELMFDSLIQQFKAEDAERQAGESL